jgi:hypothetical protein
LIDAERPVPGCSLRILGGTEVLLVFELLVALVPINKVLAVAVQSLQTSIILSG